MGQVPWNKGKKGISEETRLKMRTAKLGKHLSETHRKNLTHPAWNKGLKDSISHTPETRKKISETNKKNGIGKWMVGRHAKEETKKKISIANSGKKRPWVKGHPRGWRHSMDTRKKLSGVNSHWWKGGVTAINHVIRSSIDYKLWRKAVFERDNYTCVWCKIRGGELNADHIKPFCDYPELRFAIDNGRTLCVPCHRTTETWGRNTKKQ